MYGSSTCMLVLKYALTTIMRMLSSVASSSFCVCAYPEVLGLISACLNHFNMLQLVHINTFTYFMSLKEYQISDNWEMETKGNIKDP